MVVLTISKFNCKFLLAIKSVQHRKDGLELQLRQKADSSIEENGLFFWRTALGGGFFMPKDIF